MLLVSMQSHILAQTSVAPDSRTHSAKVAGMCITYKRVTDRMQTHTNVIELLLENSKASGQHHCNHITGKEKKVNHKETCTLSITTLIIVSMRLKMHYQQLRLGAKM